MLKLFAKAVVGTSKSAVFRPFSTLIGRYDGDGRSTFTLARNGAVIQTDATKDDRGKGELFSPTDLLAVMGIFAARHKIDITGTEVHVDKEMAPKPLKRLGKLPVLVRVRGSPLNDQQKRALEAVASQCPVHASLHTDIQSPITFVYDN